MRANEDELKSASNKITQLEEDLRTIGEEFEKEREEKKDLDNEKEEVMKGYLEVSYIVDEAISCVTSANNTTLL